MSIFRRWLRSVRDDQAAAAVIASKESLRQVYLQSGAVEDITKRLRVEHERNHFGEAIAAAMRRK